MQNILEEAKKIRRYLHMYPELGFDLDGTASFIETYLSDIGIRTERVAGTGVIEIGRASCREKV